MRFGFDEREMRRNWKRAARMGKNMSRDFKRFGADGVFGPDGPFGEDGPFGPERPFGPGGPFGNGRGGRRGGRGRRRRFDRAELRLLLLSLIADQPRHGYDLIKAIEELSAGEYAPSPGVIYPTLQMMLDEGLIAELPDDTSRKVFEATDAGRKVLADEEKAVAAVIERLAEVGQQVRSQPNRQMHRAMENLRNSVRLHRHSGDLDEEKLEQIVDIIDDAARRIERL